MAKTPSKRCTHCGESLPLTAFNQAGSSRDGRATICRRCANMKRRPYRPPAHRDPMRAAIKKGDIAAVRAHFARTRFSDEQMLAMAVQDYNTAPKHDGHVKIIEFLLAKGAPAHWQLLIESARTGSQALVDCLIAAGVERNIFTCAVTGDVALARKLLKRDATLARSTTSTTRRAYKNNTPLHFCCMSALGRHSPVIERRFLEAGKLLIEHGADVNAVASFYGPLMVTPLDMAAHTGGNLSLAEFLLDKGARITSFTFCEALAHRGRSVEEGLALAELFLRRGYPINAPHADGTVLHRCANAGSANGVRWMVSRGADVNARGRMGRTPLHLAAERQRTPRVAEVLVEFGARLDAKDDLGMTPLDVARHHGQTAVARWLATQK